MSLYCPSWVFSAVCSLTAQRFLAESLGLEAFAAKYASELSARYSDITAEMVLDTSEGYLRHLMEAEVEDGFEILQAYSFNQLTVDKGGVPRKIKGFFSSTLDGQKTPEIIPEVAIKQFKPFIFMYRAKPDLAVPAGWTWNMIEDGDWLKTLPEVDVSFLDGI
ncbi:hypothetical protein NIG5292_02193 [Nereida ignava]|uniref:Uncharacterized protein n=1 Tax=Nereida ignava TaxID=282199 RepID=A0A0U1NN29_9RHOB|nr:hypothetical protein NIG5292_02193 [Nereida ignava]SFJ56921.1 hypothetical protein SAMN02745667_01658 [Nereida ignava DSM 16309]